MATFDEIRAGNPSAVPADTDLVIIQKSGGVAASYTLQELAAYVAGVSLPQWLTDASNGCLLTSVWGSNTTLAHTTAGVIPFNNPIRDTGYHTSEGTITVPTGVTKLQIVSQIRTADTNPVVSIIKGGDSANPIIKTTGSGGYALVVSPEMAVVAGETFQIYCEAATSILLGSQTFFNVRATEKLA